MKNQWRGFTYQGQVWSQNWLESMYKFGLTYIHVFIYREHGCHFLHRDKAVCKKLSAGDDFIAYVSEPGVEYCSQNLLKYMMKYWMQQNSNKVVHS